MCYERNLYSDCDAAKIKNGPEGGHAMLEIRSACCHQRFSPERIPQKLKCDVSAHIKRVLEDCVLFKLHGSLTMIFMGSQDI